MAVRTWKFKNLNGVNFLFSQETCKQFIDLFSKNKVATANQVGSIPNYEELSSKAFSLSQNIKQPIWILDSGASDHIVCNPTLFTSLESIHNRWVKLPDWDNSFFFPFHSS